jgi:hypothetical protein
MFSLHLKITVVSERLEMTFSRKHFSGFGMSPSSPSGKSNEEKATRKATGKMLLWKFTLETHSFLHQLPLLWLLQVPGVLQ